MLSDQTKHSKRKDVQLYMLQQIDPSEKVTTEISKLFKVLKINQLLHAANIRKVSGVKVQQIFEFIFLLAFLGKKMNIFLNSKRG